MPEHVFGSGYNSVSRKCFGCGHTELEHFGPCSKCKCGSFHARKLSRVEKRIMRAEHGGKGVQYQGEGWLNDFMRDWSKRKIEGVDD